MLLVNPPVAKPCEPPAGITRLAGAIKEAGYDCRLLDLNIGGILWLAGRDSLKADTWSSRAARNRSRNLDALRNEATYRNSDRYRKTVSDLNRLLFAVLEGDTRISLNDYEDRTLSPVRTSDLSEAADHPEDNPFFPYFSDRLREAIGASPGTRVGFSMTYLSQALTTFAMLGFVRNTFPSATIILGGALVTSWASNAPAKLDFGGLVDHLVAGPGEKFVLDMLGSATKSSKPVISQSFIFDDLPQSEYLAPGLIIPYSTSTGCYYGKCSFCPETAEGNPYIQLNPRSAAQEMKRCVEKEHPALLHIVDNAISPSVLKALIADPPGVPWYGFVRITKELTDRDFCAGLKRSGCAMLKIGVESGDREVLNAMRKGIELEHVSKALAAIRGAGIGTYVYLLFGTPWEDERAARKTLDFVVEHRDFITFLNLAIFNLPHHSPDSWWVEPKPFYGGDLSFYSDFIHPKEWDRKKVRRFLDREFTRHPAIREIIRRQPPSFTSNHAAFFCHNGTF
ncbi:MAG: radical SAM protein [Syntrophorhabdus sp.]